MTFFQQACPVEQFCQDRLQFRTAGLVDGFSGNQGVIVPGLEVWEVGLDRGSQDPLCPVAGNSIADRFTCSNPDPDVFALARQVQQNNKRVGNGFAKAPHPLKVR